MGDGPSIQSSMKATGSLKNALMNMYGQLVENVLGSQPVDKDGKPLREVCYMHMPMGFPIDPRDFSNPWTPAGGATLADFSNTGKLSPPPAAPPAPGSSTATSTPGTAPKTPPQPDPQLLHALDSARKTAVRFDRMLRVTSDGTYRPYEGGETISSAYEVIIRKAQGLPAPNPPADIQAKIDEARKVLWNVDANGSFKGKTDNYKQYQKSSQAWAAARSAFATAEAQTVTDPAAASTWPVTSSSLQMDVDNAWDDWRSAGADEIENALDTLGAVGGSVGAYFVSQARELYKAWDLGLSGVVPVNTPYTEVQPSSWYDPYDKENGFMHLEASDSNWQSSSSSSSSSMAQSWYQGQSESTTVGGGGMIFGITLGVDHSHGSSSDHWGSNATGQSFSQFSDEMSDVSISFEFGLCDIYRPWMLAEMFVIDGWYLPGEASGAVSDGTIGGQNNVDDHHFLPMLPTQFLVVRNVKITATGWADAGKHLEDYVRENQGSDQSSSSSVAGGVGWLGLGGAMSQSNADSSGQDSQSAAAAGSWSFETHGRTGILSINGGQIVGWVGEIMRSSPRISDPNLKKN
jgi:hypothetical protein